MNYNSLERESKMVLYLLNYTVLKLSYVNNFYFSIRVIPISSSMDVYVVETVITSSILMADVVKVLYCQVF